MGTIYDINENSKNEELTFEEVKAMEEYKDLSDEEIKNIIESVRVFTEIIYALFLKEEQQGIIESQTKIISINSNQQLKKVA